LLIILYAPHLAREGAQRGVRYYLAHTPYAGRGRPGNFLDETKKNFGISLRKVG